MIYLIIVLKKNDFVRPKKGNFKVYVGIDAKDYNKLSGEVKAKY